MRPAAPRRILLLTVVFIGLAGCASQPSGPSIDARDKPARDGPPKQQPDIDISEVPEPKPEPEPLSRSGNPVSYKVMDKRYHVLFSNKKFTQTGQASWYGRKFHGRKTASGEAYDMFKMTAAHKRLPLPSYVHVTNLDNGRDVIVRVNDRGPFHGDRIIDLSYAAAIRLDMVGHGTVRVRVRALTLAGRNIEQAASPALYLQTGAFSKPSNARDLAARLESMGVKRVFVTPTNDPDPLYRVRVGPFDSTDKLAATRDTLTEAGVVAHTLRD